jgi:charged multivesicular body protein 6
MKNQRDALHKYQRRITVLTDRETEIAKALLAKGDKPRALLALRRKKYQQSLLEKTDGQLEQLEKLTSSVEFALVQKDVVFGLQQGTAVLQEIHKEMGGLEHVEKLMEDTAEAVAYQEVRITSTGLLLCLEWPHWIGRMELTDLQEVSDMLGGKISNADEDDVEDELEALEALVSGVKIAPMPDAPTAELPRKDRAKAREKQREETRVAHEAMLA